MSCDWWILRILTSDWSGAQGGQDAVRHPAGVHPDLDPLQRAGCDEGNSYFCNTISWTHEPASAPSVHSAESFLVS